MYITLCRAAHHCSRCYIAVLHTNISIARYIYNITFLRTGAFRESCTTFILTLGTVETFGYGRDLDVGVSGKGQVTTIFEEYLLNV